MKWVCARLVLMAGCIALLVLHLYQVSVPVGQDVGNGIVLMKEVKKEVRPPRSRVSWPPCQRNESVANISGFSSLGTNVKDFLYYRHCRHFPLMLDVPDKCGGADKSGDVFLLLVIKSSPWNYERREVLRKTWAKERLQDGVWIRRVFISGTTSTGYERQRLNRLLQLENEKYQDVLQWDFDDTFFNLTLKQVLFLEWMQVNCPNARFHLNGDDDVFAHTNNMVEYLRGLKDNDGSKHHFTGHLIAGVGPIRDKKSKYYIPVELQKSNKYPPYCGGGGFLLSGHTAKVIYNMSQSITIFPIDDVYMGMCLEKAGLKPTFHMGVKTAGLRIPFKPFDVFDPCFYKDVLLVHRFLPPHLFLLWNQTQNPDLKCFTSE